MEGDDNLDQFLAEANELEPMDIENEDLPPFPVVDIWKGLLAPFFNASYNGWFGAVGSTSLREVAVFAQPNYVALSPLDACAIGGLSQLGSKSYMDDTWAETLSNLIVNPRAHVPFLKPPPKATPAFKHMVNTLETRMKEQDADINWFFIYYHDGVRTCLGNFPSPDSFPMLFFVKHIYENTTSVAPFCSITGGMLAIWSGDYDTEFMKKWLIDLGALDPDVNIDNMEDMFPGPIEEN